MYHDSSSLAADNCFGDSCASAALPGHLASRYERHVLNDGGLYSTLQVLDEGYVGGRIRWVPGCRTSPHFPTADSCINRVWTAVSPSSVEMAHLSFVRQRLGGWFMSPILHPDHLLKQRIPVSDFWTSSDTHAAADDRACGQTKVASRVRSVLYGSQGVGMSPTSPTTFDLNAAGQLHFQGLCSSTRHQLSGGRGVREKMMGSVAGKSRRLHAGSMHVLAPGD